MVVTSKTKHFLLRILYTLAKSEQKSNELRRYILAESKCLNYTLLDVFHIFDFDRSGFITPEKLVTILRKHNANFQQRDAETLVRLLSNAQSSHISFDDFALFLTTTEKQCHLHQAKDQRDTSCIYHGNKKNASSNSVGRFCTTCTSAKAESSTAKFLFYELKMCKKIDSMKIQLLADPHFCLLDGFEFLDALNEKQITHHGLLHIFAEFRWAVNCEDINAMLHRLDKGKTGNLSLQVFLNVMLPISAPFTSPDRNLHANKCCQETFPINSCHCTSKLHFKNERALDVAKFDESNNQVNCFKAAENEDALLKENHNCCAGEAQEAICRCNKQLENTAEPDVRVQTNKSDHCHLMPCNYKLFRLFSQQLSLVQQMKRLQQALSIRPDFNLVQLWQLLDPGCEGFADAAAIKKCFQNLGVSFSSLELELYLHKFSRVKDSRCRYLDLCDAFVPTNPLYAEKLINRIPNAVCVAKRGRVGIYGKTKALVAKLIKTQMQLEVLVYRMRLSAEAEDMQRVFYAADTDNDGYVTVAEFQKLLQSFNLPASLDDTFLLLDRYTVNPSWPNLSETSI